RVPNEINNNNDEKYYNKVPIENTLVELLDLDLIKCERRENYLNEYWVTFAFCPQKPMYLKLKHLHHYHSSHKKKKHTSYHTQCELVINGEHCVLHTIKINLQEYQTTSSVSGATSSSSSSK